MKLKTKKFTKEVNRIFAEYFDFDDVDFIFDTTWYRYGDEVHFCPFLDEPNDMKYKRFLFEEFQMKVENMFFFSFMHELGHIVTLDDFREDEPKAYKKSRKGEKKIIKKLNKGEPVGEYDYFRLPHEYIATEWAVNTIKDNPEKVVKACTELNNALVTFLQKNQKKI